MSPNHPNHGILDLKNSEWLILHVCDLSLRMRSQLFGVAGNEAISMCGALMVGYVGYFKAAAAIFRTFKDDAGGVRPPRVAWQV